MSPNDSTPPDFLAKKPQTTEPTTDANLDSPEARQYVLIIYILYGIGVITGLSSLIGVIMAYVKRDDLANTPYADHITYLIRTFWIALGASAIGFVTTPILIGLLILPLVFVWYVYRCIVGFIKFNEHKPIDPLNWL